MEGTGRAEVVSLPVDALHVPARLVDLLGAGGAAYFEEQYLIGYWPAALAARLDAHLAAGHRSVRSWLTACAATAVSEPHAIGNANTPADLEGFSSGASSPAWGRPVSGHPRKSRSLAKSGSDLHEMVLPKGIEPLTSALPRMRSAFSMVRYDPPEVVLKALISLLPENAVRSSPL